MARHTKRDEVVEIQSPRGINGDGEDVVNFNRWRHAHRLSSKAALAEIFVALERYQPKLRPGVIVAAGGRGSSPLVDLLGPIGVIGAVPGVSD